MVQAGRSNQTDRMGRTAWRFKGARILRLRRFVRLMVPALCAVFLVAAGQPVRAAEQGNLPDYSGPDCRVPLRPLPGDGRRDWEWYRRDMDAYRVCVRNWLDAAERDLTLIRERMEQAVRAYNRESGNSF